MVEILLATYNGEHYLKDQLDSVLTQDCTDFTLTVRDDGSTDNTVSIIKKYVSKLPERIRLIETDSEYSSAKNNFTQLMQNANPKSDYYCFCCQDDIWNAGKLSKQLEKMAELEALPGVTKLTPLLVHSDMTIIDTNRNVLHPSYAKFVNTKPAKINLKRMLVENSVIGMTCMFNAALLKMSKDIPDNAVSHDWWVALYAAAAGKIGFIKEPLVKYRQHMGNTTGAHCGRPMYIIKNWKNISEDRFETQKSFYQATAFAEAAKLLSPDKMKIVTTYGELADADKFKRMSAVLFQGYSKRGIIRTLAQAINC